MGVTSDEGPVVAGVVTSGWEWHRESQKGRKSRAYSQLPVDRVGFAANSLEGSERACQCASMSVRPIRRSSIRAPPSTPFSSTKEPLGYQGAPSAPSLSTSNAWPNQLPKSVSSPSSLKSQNHQNNFHQSSYCHQHTVLSSNVARSSSNKIRQTSSHCSELLFRACRFHHSKEYCQPPKIGT